MPSRPSSEAGVPGGGAARPAATGYASRKASDRGSVTAETAVLLPGLVGVLALLLGVVGQGLDQVRSTDAARSAARLIARGEATDAVRDAAMEEAPSGARVAIDHRDGRVVVTITAPGRRLVPGLRLPDVTATATVAEESTAGWRWP